MRKMRTAAALFGASAMLITAACGSDDTETSTGTGSGDDATEAEAKPAELTFVISATAIGPKEDMVLAAAKQLGYFEEEGITLNIENADGSQASLQAIVSGSADISAAEAGVIAVAVNNGLPVVATGGVVQNFPWQIATTPDSDIESGEDLKGKKIGVISLASGSYPYSKAFVEASGLNPDSDVEFLPVGTGAQALGALEGGQVDALGLYGQGYQVIENTGVEFKYLENPDFFDGIRSITFVVSKDSLAKNADAIGRFQRAFYKGLVFAAENPEATVQYGYDEFPQVLNGADPSTRIADDVKSMERWLASALPLDGTMADWSDWGFITDEEWEATQNYLVKTAQLPEALPLEDIWSDSLLKSSNEFDKDAAIADAKAGYKG